MDDVRMAVYMAVGLVVGLVARENAKARAADRLGDPSPRRWGRVSLNPKAMMDPFGSVFLPAILVFLVATGQGFLPVFGYAKPMPSDAGHLRRGDRDTTRIALAGPGANLVLAAVAGGLLRVLPLGDEAARLAFAFLWVNLILCVFHLMPVPGLDGATILARFLPPRPRAVYSNLDQYLPLFMLVIFFLLAAPVVGIVNALAGGLCRILTGLDC